MSNLKERSSELEALAVESKKLARHLKTAASLDLSPAEIHKLTIETAQIAARLENLEAATSLYRTKHALGEVRS